jgi:hypothetical protein
VIEPLIEVRMGHCDDPRIGLAGSKGQRQSDRGRAPDEHSIGRVVSVPEQRGAQLASQDGGAVSTSDEKVDLGGIRDDAKASATSRSDHDHFLDGVMSAQTMSRPDRCVPAGEDANLHEGSTGFQAESGMTTSESRRRIRRKAAIAPRMMMGEIRFTGAVYGCRPGCPSSGEPVPHNRARASRARSTSPSVL